MKVLLRLSVMVRRYPWQMAAAYLALLGASAFALAVPRLLGAAVDQALGAKDLSVLLVLAGVILVVSLLRGLSTYGQSYLGEAVSQRVAYDLRNAFYDKLQHLSFAYHDQQQTGNLMSKATADVESVRWFIQQGLLRMAYLVMLVGGAAVLMLATNWRLALLSLAFVPFVAWRTTVVRLALQRVWMRIQTLLGEMTTVLQENLAGVRVVRAFGAEEFEKAKFNSKAGMVADFSVKANILQTANTAQVSFAFALALGAILGYGAFEVLAGRLTPGQLTQFIFYQGLLAQPVRQMGFVINVFSRAISSGERLFEVLDATSPVQEKPEALKLGRALGHVRFERVSFSYNNSLPVLRDVSFEARPGRMVALLGAPGSGKTSVAHLVPRFYDVTRGRVTIDGIDVREVTLESLRRNVGIVMQDVFIFNATLRQNIAYGHPEATEEMVLQASRTTQLHEFVDTLPKGYDTWVGERGITVSGGQRQRLSIARAILLDPPILILDDTMSSVDAETEHRLKLALADVMRDRTTFVIAHRLSTVMAADLVLVIDQGEIVERGTHRELLERDGFYREIYKLQLLPQEEAKDSVPASRRREGG